ncbi:MAG: hypothetical protein QXX38_01560 [Candidatus Aenigmatarchaeota archaeon]
MKPQKLFIRYCIEEQIFQKGFMICSPQSFGRRKKKLEKYAYQIMYLSESPGFLIYRVRGTRDYLDMILKREKNKSTHTVLFQDAAEKFANLEKAKLLDWFVEYKK